MYKGSHAANPRYFKANTRSQGRSHTSCPRLLTLFCDGVTFFAKLLCVHRSLSFFQQPSRGTKRIPAKSTCLKLLPLRAVHRPRNTPTLLPKTAILIPRSRSLVVAIQTRSCIPLNSAVPDCNGVRFCRVCNEFLPICAFPTGQRRYTCKTHLWMRVGIKAQKKLLAKPGKKLLSCNMEQLLQGRATSGPVSGSGCAGSVTDVDAKTLGLCSTPGRPSSRRDRSWALIPLIRWHCCPST